MKPMIRSIFVAVSVLAGLFVGGTGAFAQAFTLTPSNTTVTGAKFISNDSRIQFNAQGEMTVSTLQTTANTTYQISLMGQNNQSTSYFQFFIDPDGSGSAPYTQLGGNYNFGNGFNSVTLPTFVSLGTAPLFKIVVGGTGRNNGEGQIQTSIILAAVAVPGPVAGAGLLSLLGLAAGCYVALFAHRRRQRLAV